MPTLDMDTADLVKFYDLAAKAYCKALPRKHFMEAIPQSTQRRITLSAFEQIAEFRPDIQCFNELLVQYPRNENLQNIAQVVPDNFIVLHDAPIVAQGSFNTPIQPVGLFLVLEYVSRESHRKDYEDNRRRYEHDLEIPYFLLFSPDFNRLDLLHLVNGAYQNVSANASGLRSIPELELDVALLDSWVRFWFRGKLLPLTGELVQEVEAMRGELAKTRARLSEAEAEIARLKAEIARQTNTESSQS